jgi:hypothetical protein
MVNIFTTELQSINTRFVTELGVEGIDVGGYISISTGIFQDNGNTDELNYGVMASSLVGRCMWRNKLQGIQRPQSVWSRSKSAGLVRQICEACAGKATITVFENLGNKRSLVSVSVQLYTRFCFAL